ncbi:hypothetical protein Btru_033927 [Bulinus truncatus]|nr:hypothetical protein Btru_033927 [Bulinus truncatus]
MPLPDLGLRGGIVYLMLVLAIPIQYYISNTIYVPSGQRDASLKRFINSLSNFHYNYLSISSWHRWCSNVLKKVDGWRTAQHTFFTFDDEETGESPAIEVIQYKHPQGNFATSTNIRSPRPSEVKFRVGQVVRHKIWGYRGVIVGWDPIAKAPEEWLDKMHPPDKWRDRSDPQMTYVPEENLEAITDTEIKHPNVQNYFDSFNGVQFLLTPRPIKETKEEELNDTLKEDAALVKASEGLAVDVYVFDNHVSNATQIQPGDYVLLVNMHSAVVQDQVELTLHGGTSYGRKVIVLPHDDNHVVKLKSVLDPIVERSNRTAQATKRGHSPENSDKEPDLPNRKKVCNRNTNCHASSPLKEYSGELLKPSTRSSDKTCGATASGSQPADKQKTQSLLHGEVEVARGTYSSQVISSSAESLWLSAYEDSESESQDQTVTSHPSCSGQGSQGVIKGKGRNHFSASPTKVNGDNHAVDSHAISVPKSPVLCEDNRPIVNVISPLIINDSGLALGTCDSPDANKSCVSSPVSSYHTAPSPDGKELSPELKNTGVKVLSLKNKKQKWHSPESPAAAGTNLYSLRSINRKLQENEEDDQPFCKNTYTVNYISSSESSDADTEDLDSTLVHKKGGETNQVIRSMLKTSTGECVYVAGECVYVAGECVYVAGECVWFFAGECMVFLQVNVYMMQVSVYDAGECVYVAGEWVYVAGECIYVAGECVYVAGECVYVAGECVYVAGECVYVAGECIYVAGECVYVAGECVYVAVILGHHHIPFSTLSEVIRHKKPYKFRVLAKVRSYSPKPLCYHDLIHLYCNQCKAAKNRQDLTHVESMVCSCNKNSPPPLFPALLLNFTLTDGKHSLLAHVFGACALKFFHCGSPLDLKDTDKFRKVKTFLEDLSPKDADLDDLPFMECCLMSYTVGGKVRYQIFDTVLV